MNIPDSLHCVFSARVDEQHGSYLIEIPKQEVANGVIQPGTVYRMALLATSSCDGADSNSPDTPSKTSAKSSARSDRSAAGPPVQEGDVRQVDIENIGDEGDGIARVERGYVIIVPDVDKGERVTIQVTDVQENVAFSEVVERNDHFS